MDISPHLNTVTRATSIRLRASFRQRASGAAQQEDFLCAVGQPDPPRSDDVNPQHEVGIAEVEAGYDDFGVADSLSADFQSGKPMDASAQLFWPCAAQDCRAVTGQQNGRQPQSQRSAGGEHRQLRTGLEARINLVAIELHRKEQMVPLRSAGGYRDIGL